LIKLQGLDYYQELFTFVYGDATVTEARLQLALAQFTKSIFSFDSRFDQGRVQVNGIGADFPNFSADENAGKRLFLDPPNAGGAGCQGCHRAPEFDIRANSGHNGVFGVAGSTTQSDLTNTRSPSLRDVVRPDGSPNGPFMHDGSLATLLDVVNHYDSIQAPAPGTLLTQWQATVDNRLLPGGNPQQLNLSAVEKAQLVAFLRTLSGSAIYTDAKWSDPF
jgi:cytochrome c peroxidase